MKIKTIRDLLYYWEAVKNQKEFVEKMKRIGILKKGDLK